MFSRQFDPIVSMAIDAVKQKLQEANSSGDNSQNNPQSAMKLAQPALEMAARSLIGKPLPTDAYNVLANFVIRDIFYLGPLEELLSDNTITEIMVNAPDDVRIERNGKIVNVNVHFFNDEHIRRVIERLVTNDNRRCDEAVPMQNCILQRPGSSCHGSRVNVTIPPASIDHPTITIRKFRDDAMTPDELIANGSMDEKTAQFLEALVLGRMNIMIIGGTGSGKTTMLNTCSNFIPDDQRIITIEDTAELKLQNDHVIRLQSRDANAEGAGEITIQDLLINTLRQRPDRIVVGECRGAEAMDMLQAMSTGHDGSLTTLHANNAKEAVSRVQTLINMTGYDLTVSAIRELYSQAVDFIVTVKRYPDGSRKISEIVEICGMETDTVITMEPIIKFHQTGEVVDKDGHRRIVGEFKSTGGRPNADHMERFHSNGVQMLDRWFM